MADENKKTGPDLNVRGTDPKDLSSTIKEVRKFQGDYNDEIKDSLKQLNAIARSYDSIKSKLESLNKQTLNIKELEKQKSKSLEKQSFEANKLKDLQKKAGEEGIRKAKTLFDLEKAIKDQESKARRSKEIGDIKEQQIALSLLKIAEKERKQLLDNIKPTEIALAAQMKSKDLADQQLELVEEYLENEKDVAKQVGITGKFLALTTKYLGVGKNLQSKIVEETRNGTSGTKIFVDILATVGSSMFGIAKLFKSVFDYILGIQDKTVKFARALNISTAEARRIKMEYASFSISSGDVLINTQKLLEAQMELTDVLGITNTLNAQNLATVSKLKDFAGLEADTRAGLATTALITGKSVEQTTKSILSQVVGLKNATGIGFQYQKILSEAAKLGGVLGLQFAKYPEKLTRALITTKSLGLELKQLDSIADSFLDFESSISKEFEAQLLTGKNINLMRARELFLNNDLAGAAAEITKQVGSANEFLNMNRIQQESIAGAMGMSRDSLADMLKQQEMMAAFGAKNTKELYAQVEAYRKQGREREAIAKLGSEDAYQSLINASAQERIAGFIDKIKQSLADFVERTGIIDKIENMIKFLSKPENIRAVVIQVRDVFASLVEIVATLASGIISTLDFFGAISDQKAASAQAFLSGAADKVRSLGGDFGAVSVSDNTLKTQVNTGGSQSAAVDNMSMAPKQPINLHVTTYVKDNKKDAVVRYGSSPNQDSGTSLITSEP
jgi:hypothetical protein